MVKGFEKKQRILYGHLVSFYVHKGRSDMPTLLFVHGWRSNSGVWKRVLDPFIGKGYSIALIDMPGFGASETPKYPFSISDYTEIVHECIHSLALEKVVYVGHSFGGRVGIKLSTTYPNHIDKLVLVDSAGVRNVGFFVNASRALSKAVGPLFKLPVLRGLRKKIYTMLGAEDYLATPKLKETFSRVNEENLTSLLSEISHKTLLLWGSEDKATPLSHGELMHEKISHSKLVVFEGAGHYSFLDEPKHFTDELIHFLENESN